MKHAKLRIKFDTEEEYQEFLEWYRSAKDNGEFSDRELCIYYMVACMSWGRDKIYERTSGAVGRYELEQILKKYPCLKELKHLAHDEPGSVKKMKKRAEQIFALRMKDKERYERVLRYDEVEYGIKIGGSTNE